MGHSQFDPVFGDRKAWNAGRIVGAKRALKAPQVWAIRFWLDHEGRLRDRALFDLAIDSAVREQAEDDMAVLTFMDISTAHLTAGDVAILDGLGLPCDNSSYDHGWIVSTASLVSDDFKVESLDRLRASGVSEPFLAAVTAAGERGCWLLRFDADADEDPSLPIGGYGLEVEDN